MKNLLLTLIVVLLYSSTFSQDNWQKHGVKIPPPICYGSGVNSPHYIPPPDQYLKRLKSTKTKTANIVVNYVGFPENVKHAFQAAVDIWESLIYSPVPIYLTAKWTSLNSVVLGSCGPYAYYENFESAPYKDHYYPVALVEKLEGKEVTDSLTPDLYAQFNKDNKDWYFGTDGQTPAGKYDFESVVLHEIAHGLGFTGFFYQVGSQGTYGDVLPYPGIFDEFVINANDDQLVDTTIFPNPSTLLYKQFTSNSLHYLSPTAKSKDPNGFYPRLYAPTTFDDGSSIYHLNEDTYPPGNENSLMTPYFDMKEPIHDPGPLVLGIFADMGWNFTQVIHKKLQDVEVLNDPIDLQAEVRTDSQIDSSSVMFIYSTDAFQTSDTIQMAYDGARNLFSANWENVSDGNFSYYLAVDDTSGRTYYLPADAPKNAFEFTIGPDTQKPIASHTPISYLLEDSLSTDITVEASDNIGIKDVSMEYYVNDGGMQKLVLQPDSTDFYKANLQLENLVDGDSVRYRIVTTDSSLNANQTVLPQNGYYTFYIEGFRQPVKSYFNDFNAKSRDFISSDFYVGTASLFDNGSLNSPHPYPSPGQNDMNYNFVAVLKYPIIITKFATMSFNEVVLVEPGENNSVFGDENFYDYVVVEGSKNGKDNWLPLLNGYDSRANANWKANYVSNEVGENSTAVGEKSMYINRSFSMIDNGNFQRNDTIFVRFRLFSDPYAHGWGWTIDDLKIQYVSTDTHSITFSPGEIRVFPNPAENDLFIQGDLKSEVEKVTISIFNAFGQNVRKEELSVHGTNFNHQINIHSLQPGIYLVAVDFDNGQRITRKIVKR